MATEQAGTGFQAAYKKLRDRSEKEPEYFDFACRVMKLVDSGTETTMGAIMAGLKEAYELGRAGKPVEQDPAMKRFRETGSTEDTTAPRNRIVRRPQ